MSTWRDVKSAESVGSVAWGVFADSTTRRTIWRCLLACDHYREVSAVAAPVKLSCNDCGRQLSLPLYLPPQTETWVIDTRRLPAPILRPPSTR